MTIRLGMLTPSSNTVLEPATQQLAAGLPSVSAHFSRFKVTQIALSADALHQFDDAPILRAAELLADAKVDVIAWNGTSASWLGFERDERLVERIEAATGIKAATCVLGYRALLRHMPRRRIGLVTPYTTEVQERIQMVWKKEGLPCVAERHIGLSDNFSFAEVDEDEIERMIRAVVSEGADAVAILCTNMRGAAVAARLETELDVTILDSVAVTLKTCLDQAGFSSAPLAKWGRLFSAPPLDSP